MPAPSHTPAGVAGETTGPAHAFRTLLGAGVGNTLEWYDWSVYALFAPFFAAQFFIAGTPTASLLSTLAVFAVGFFMRPIGGFLFGWLADRHGRRFALVTSMLLMAGGSLVIGLAPTATRVGIWAAVILVIARLAQGLAHGGEIAASYTYIAEVAPRDRRGLWSTSLYVSVTAGIVLASLIGAGATSLLGAATMRDWAWRIPFLIGAALGLVGLYLRRTLPETGLVGQGRASAGSASSSDDLAAGAVASASGSGGRASATAGSGSVSGFGSGAQQPDPAVRRAEDARPSVAPSGVGALLRGLARNKASLARIVGLSMGVTVVYYIWAVGISGFAISAKGVAPSGALWGSVIANVFFIVTLPLWGKLSDRFGRKPIFLAYSAAFVVLSFPLLGVVNNSAIRLTLIMMVALFFLGAFVGIMPGYFAELFPTAVRASGIGVPYSLVVALFGGTAPYLLTWLNSRNQQWLFTLYMVVLVAIGLVTTLLTPETKGRDLT